MEITAICVEDAFRKVCEYFEHSAFINYCDTRNGRVLKAHQPVTLYYVKPQNRVLLNAERDANPFFHVYESLWMLAGCNSVKPLHWFVRNMANYSDNGVTFNGAYGHRWRKADGDQLEIIIDHLTREPNSRRAVLQMWNVRDDLLKIETSKDVCCNTNAYFSINQRTDTLNMTVCNRSNDAIWGCLGANAVHFSFLQEYIALALNKPMGTYTHFTNDLHIYESLWKSKNYKEHQTFFYNHTEVEHIPLYNNRETFDNELALYLEDSSFFCNNYFENADSPFLRLVASPMITAYWHYRNGDLRQARKVCETIPSADWRLACVNWIDRRITRS